MVQQFSTQQSLQSLCIDGLMTLACAYAQKEGHKWGSTHFGNCSAWLCAGPLPLMQFPQDTREPQHAHGAAQPR